MPSAMRAEGIAFRRRRSLAGMEALGCDIVGKHVECVPTEKSRIYSGCIPDHTCGISYEVTSKGEIKERKIDLSGRTENMEKNDLKNLISLPLPIEV